MAGKARATATTEATMPTVFVRGKKWQLASLRSNLPQPAETEQIKRMALRWLGIAGWWARLKRNGTLADLVANITALIRDTDIIDAILELFARRGIAPQRFIEALDAAQMQEVVKSLGRSLQSRDAARMRAIAKSLEQRSKTRKQKPVPKKRSLRNA